MVSQKRELYRYKKRKVMINEDKPQRNSYKNVTEEDAKISEVKERERNEIWRQTLDKKLEKQ